MIPILDAQLTVSEFSDKQKSGLSKSVSEVYNKLDLIGADAAAEQINSVTKQMFDEYSSESIISRYSSYCYNRDYDRNVFVNYGKASVPIAEKLEKVKPPFGPGLYNEKAVKSDAKGEKYYSKLKEDLTNDLKKDPILSNGVCISDLSDYVKSDNFRRSYDSVSVYDYLEAQGIDARRSFYRESVHVFNWANNFLDGGGNVEFFPANQVLTEVYDYDTFPLGRGEGDLMKNNKGDHIYVNAITPKGTKGDLCLYKRLETFYYNNDYLGDTHVFLSTDWTMLGFRETKRSKEANPAKKCSSYMKKMCLNDDRRPDRTYPVDKDDIIPVSMNIGSVFSGGNIWIIIVVIGLFTVVVAVSVVIYIKSKKKAAFAQADASEAFENTEAFDTLETPEQTDTSEPSEQSEPSEPSE